MNNTVDKIMKVSLEEVGYLEKSKAAYVKNPAVLNSKKDGAGMDNYTKYGKEMHDLYPAVMDFPASWCDCFVDWCMQKAYGISSARAMLQGDFDDYTCNSAGLYKKKNFYVKTPEIGAQIFFQNGTRICHTGLVYRITADKIYTVEGNTSSGPSVVSNGGAVCLKEYLKTNTRIDGYGIPNYEGPRLKLGDYITTTDLWIRNTPVLSKSSRVKTSACTVNKKLDVEGFAKLPKGSKIHVQELVANADGTIFAKGKSGYYTAVFNKDFKVKEC